MLSETDSAILQSIAEGGPLDYAIWQDLLPRLIARLEKIAFDDFPVPAIDMSLTRTTAALSARSQAADPSSSLVASQTTDGSSRSMDKENAPPSALHPSVPQNDILEGTIPPPLMSLICSITQTLTTYFSQYPPHTIQRLSELILEPKQYYRTLPSYLHAVDRVVHVTSGANTYPLPAAIQDTKSLPNGVNNATDLNSILWGSTGHNLSSLGSDESLGGALLTPIPWLRSHNQESTTNGSGGKQTQEFEGEVKTESTETIDGPNGAGRVETVSVSVNGIPSISASPTASKENEDLRSESGVTQGELLRQEQRAGVVPAAQLTATHGSGNIEGLIGEDDETPHARGPEEIGMEDMGPQVAGSVGVGMQRIDVEAAVGRKGDGNEQEELEDEQAHSTPKRGASDTMESDSKRIKDGIIIGRGECIEDENMVMVDISGKAS